MRVLMAELDRRRSKLGRKKGANFSACSRRRGSTFSTFVKLNQSYENICFVFDHRTGARRIPRLPKPEEGRVNGDHIHGRDDDPWSVDDDQEELEHQEELDHHRSVANCVGEEDHEEEGRG